VEGASDQSRGEGHLYALTDEGAYLQTDDNEKPAIIAEPPIDRASFKCWFCRKSHPQVRRLYGFDYAVRDPNTFAVITLIFICNECVTTFAEWQAQESLEAQP
jgi:hypothetical protein